MDFSEWVTTIASLIVIAATAVAGVMWNSVKAGAVTAAEKQAEEAIRRLNWPAILARELEQVRGSERQELRFASYGQLWETMKPLAIYSEEPVNSDTIGDLSTALSGWYFSASGGLLLTSHNRDLYFALQDLLNGTADIEQGWSAERIRDPKRTFTEVLEHYRLTKAQALVASLTPSVPDDWPDDDVEPLARGWREDLRSLVSRWGELTEPERFAVLQQASSVLRTGLTYDVESRLR